MIGADGSVTQQRSAGERGNEEAKKNIVRVLAFGALRFFLLSSSYFSTNGRDQKDRVSARANRVDGRRERHYGMKGGKAGEGQKSDELEPQFHGSTGVGQRQEITQTVKVEQKTQTDRHE